MKRGEYECTREERLETWEDRSGEGVQKRGDHEICSSTFHGSKWCEGKRNNQERMRITMER